MKKLVLALVAIAAVGSLAACNGSDAAQLEQDRANYLNDSARILPEVSEVKRIEWANGACKMMRESDNTSLTRTILANSLVTQLDDVDRLEAELMTADAVLAYCPETLED